MFIPNLDFFWMVAAGWKKNVLSVCNSNSMEMFIIIRVEGFFCLSCLCRHCYCCSKPLPGSNRVISLFSFSLSFSLSLSNTHTLTAESLLHLLSLTLMLARSLTLQRDTLKESIYTNTFDILSGCVPSCSKLWIQPRTLKLALHDVKWSPFYFQSCSWMKKVLSHAH